MHINFFAGDKFDSTKLRKIENFVEEYPDFQTLWLNSMDELEKLINLLGMTYEIEYYETEYAKNIINLSRSKYPILNKIEFDSFYREWLILSGRENNFDEYAMLSVLLEMAEEWNEFKYRGLFEEF